MLGSLFNEVACFQACNFLKETPTQGFPVDIAIFLRTFFIIKHLQWLFLTVLLQYSKVGCLFFDFAPPRAFDFDQKLTQNIVQVILYYHVTRQFLPCLNWLIMYLWFQNMSWKNSWFHIWFHILMKNLHTALHK